MGQGSQARIHSIDAFRGFLVAVMILLMYPGSSRYLYPAIRPTEWHGISLTDFIFPLFLFVMGIAIVLALPLRATLQGHGNAYGHILVRTLILLALGVLLNAIPDFHWGSTRIPGILQRVAISYLFAALIVLSCSELAQALIAAVLVIAYYFALHTLKIDGFGAGNLTPTGNLVGHIDHLLLGRHALQPIDPEGVLSTVPAIVTVLSGALAGHLLRNVKGAVGSVIMLLLCGAVMVGLGYFLKPWMPLNKKLWTSTFVLLTSGAGFILLAFFYGIIDVLRWKKWSLPLIIFGRNALATFVLSTLLLRLMTEVIKVTNVDGSRSNLYHWIYQNIFYTWAGPMNGSLAFAVSFVIFWLGFMAILYRANVFIKL